MSATLEQPNSGSLGLSFTIAAWVVILGVVGSWVYLKQGVGHVSADLPDLPSFTLTTMQDINEVTWIEQAEQAYAAGRIARPEGDSALHYYQKMLQRDAKNTAALEGITRVVDFLINGAETALLRQDWTSAEDYSVQALAINASNIAAKSVISRVQRIEEIGRLSEQAIAQIAAGNLTRPESDNALESYRAILALDPASPVALQGVESVAQRLATIAQTEAFAENHGRAKELIALAKQIAPNAPGIAQSEKLTLQWTDMVKDQAVKDDLIAAAHAMQEGYLIGIDSPNGIGALDHYRSVLKKDASSAAAKSGVELVIAGLMDRTNTLIASDDIEASEALIEHTIAAGASSEDLLEVLAGVDFLKRRSAARAGQFNEIIPIRDLVARRQGTPVLPRNADAGWVELLFTVDEEGSIEDIVVVESSRESLISPAVSAVNKWRFEPYLDNGKPIAVRSGVRFSFQT